MSLQSLLREQKSLFDALVATEIRLEFYNKIGDGLGAQSEERYIKRVKLRLSAIERELEELEIN